KRAYCLKTQPATGETYPKSDLFNKAKFTRKEAILTPLVHFNKTSITSDCWQILFFSPDHFNNDFY
ncbi:hypothetical protein OFN18_09485, partial [Escherichia coli]|nr:hypothetical protein [Escherichia coli]